MAENNVAYVLSKEDGTRRLVFAVGSLPMEKLFEIENRFEDAPYVAATSTTFGFFPVERSKRPSSTEKMVPQVVIDGASVVSGERMRRHLATEEFTGASDVRGWRVVGAEGDCHVVILPRAVQEVDVATICKAIVGDRFSLNRVVGGSYPTGDDVCFGMAPVFGPTVALETGAPSLRM